MSFVVVAVVAFLFGLVGSMPLAGPISVLVVSNAVEKKYPKALGIGAGASVAEAIYAFLAFWGFATFLARYKSLLPISHGITGAVLLAVGGYFVFWCNKDAKKPKQKERHEAALKQRKSFFLGFSISALNPTLLATWGAATTFLYSKDIIRMNGALAIPFGAFAGGGVFAWDAILVALLKKLGDRFPRKALVWIVRGMGLVLVALALWSLVELVLWFVHGRPPQPARGAPG